VSRARLVARNTSRGTVLAESLEDAASFWAKFMGLMGRAPLPRGEGLWLPGENGIHMFFMRFAIDVVFVSPPGGRGGSGSPAAGGGQEAPRQVVALRRAVPPWRGVVLPVDGADGILELPVGVIDESKTELGDDIVIERPAGA
jgi:uncharacterized membrane protein (UPF0127 family)